MLPQIPTAAPQPPDGFRDRVVSADINAHFPCQPNGTVRSRTRKAEMRSRSAAQQTPVGTGQGAAAPLWGQPPAAASPGCLTHLAEEHSKEKR